MKPATFICTMLFLVFAATSHAELLWENGDPNGNQGLNNQYQSAMDDFYVPGAGWFIDSAETYGIFLNPNRVVSDVDVILWPADYHTGEPNGDSTTSLNVTSFQAIETGELWQGYEKVQINVQFDNTFLDGQEYYWIEFDVRDQYGERIKLLDRQPVAHQAAHVRSNPYPTSTVNQDLAFKVFGSDITIVPIGPIDEFASPKIDTGARTVSIYLSGKSQQFDSGLYQIQLKDRDPVVYHFDRNGNKKFDFRRNPRAPKALHTPLGDEMCPDSGSIAQFCQDFVACAAYDLFCNQGAL